MATKKQKTKITNKVSNNYFDPVLVVFDKLNPKILFFILSALIFAIMLIVAPSIGDSCDECMDGLNGRCAFNYYTKGDTAFADYGKSGLTIAPGTATLLPNNVKYYGVGFEILPPVAIALGFPSQYEYELRHVLCATFGFFLMFFTGLIGREIKNWWVACLALLIMAFTPVIYGWSFIATKDIPLATGFAIATYGLLRVYKQLPSFKIIDIIIAIIGIAIAVSVRIGGLLLPFYVIIGLVIYFLFQKKMDTKVLPKILFIVAIICLAGTLLGLCFYPNFFYEGPISHVKNAFGMASKFDIKWSILDEGVITDTQHLPSNYLFRKYLQTIPLFVFAGALFFLINFKKIRKTYSLWQLSFLLFTLLFPLLYIKLSKAIVYNGWRHTAFVYSPFAVIAAIGFYEMRNGLKETASKSWKFFYGAIVIIMFLPTLVWQIQNYRYGYCYYNILAGNPYLKYELDVLASGDVAAFNWLVEHELTDTSKHYVIAAKNASVLAHASTKKYPNIQVIQAGVLAYVSTPCDYAITDMQFLSPQVGRVFFPPKNSIHIEYVDENPVSAVVKKNPLDIEGIKLVSQNKFTEGLQKLQGSYSDNPNNFGLWFYMGICYFYLNQNDNAIVFLSNYLSLWPMPEQLPYGYAHLGVAYLRKGDFNLAVSNLQNAQNLCPPNNVSLAMFIKNNLAIALRNRESVKVSQPTISPSLRNHLPASNLSTH